MVFSHIENLQKRYTDKYVVVDDSRPELRRFRGYTGLVKTVNMSGRALVQFENFENNIGWFDIDVDFLQVVDAPPPVQEKAARHAPAKPTPSDKPTPQAAKAAPESGRSPGAGMSVQDILNAARGGTKAAPPPPPAPQQPAATQPSAPAEKAAASAGAMSVAEILAAARGQKAAGAATPAKAEAPSPAAPQAQPSEQTAAVKMETPAAKDPKQMSVAEILAAARAGKSAAPAASAPPTAPPPEVAQEPPAAPPRPAAAQPARAQPAPSAPAAPPAGELPTTTADIIAWCRQRDAK